MSQASHGTGPGVITPDGCSVEFYARMAAMGEPATRDGIIIRMRDVSRPAPNLVSATVEYVDGDQRWTQTFTATRLDRYLTEDHAWLRVVPAG